MFVQDHRLDFDAVLAAADAFALIRFGDGEMAIIDEIRHRSADAWSISGKTWIRRELLNALYTNMPGFCMGLPSPCCLSRCVRMRHACKAPLAQQTFATLFMHANLPRAHELEKRFDSAVIVSAGYGDVRVPSDGVSKTWNVDEIVEELQQSTDPILLAAGPCSNVIALRYWKRQPSDRRVPIIDVGSPLDLLRGNVTRHYHGKMNMHRCSWGERTCEPLVPRTSHVVPHRMQIGRPKASSDTQTIQRNPKKIRLGRS
jgi:hypothetical protein